MAKIYGYIRVSSVDQNESRQWIALKLAFFNLTTKLDIFLKPAISYSPKSCFTDTSPLKTMTIFSSLN